MRHNNALLVLIALLLVASAFAQRNPPLAENAALHYWSAFSEMEDSGVSGEEAKELNAILDGTASYDDTKYKDLLEKNALALEVMARATSIANCDWGLDYGLGEDLPVEYARRALTLGRLNVLYAIHLYHAGNKDQGVRALAAGLRFSHDVGNGGSLFATLIAKDLLVTHLTAVDDGLRLQPLSAAQRSWLQKAVAQLGGGLDWGMAAKRDLEGLRVHHAGDAQTSAALTQITSAYIAAIDDPSKLPALNKVIDSAPRELANLIPSAKRVLEEKQDLKNRLLQTRGLLQ